MSNLLTSEELRIKLETRNIRKVAENTGVSYQVLAGFCSGRKKQLAYDDAIVLIKWLSEN